MQCGSEMVTNLTSGSWEIEGVSSVVSIHSPDQICPYQMLKLAQTNQDSWGIAASVSEIPANLRTQNGPH